MESVYVETSVISYLTSRPSRDLIAAAHQQITWDWWEGKRRDFDLFVSELVLDEVRAGDPDAARRRLALVEDLGRIAITPEVIRFARRLVEQLVIPRAAEVDAFHVAAATVNGMDYLLTWNCRHIANARVERIVRAEARALGFEAPVICTPEGLLGESHA